MAVETITNAEVHEHARQWEHTGLDDRTAAGIRSGCAVRLSVWGL